MDELAPDPEKSFSHRLSLVLLVPLLVALVGLFATLYITHTTAYIDGPSMEPTLHSGELVLVTRGYDTPTKGDVVTAVPELNGNSPEEIVKRIVAVGGDEIQVEASSAIVNGSPERGAHTVIIGERDISVPRQVVPDGYVYVLGDNRPVSEDSRIIGPIPVEWLTGKVVAVIGPIYDIRRVD